MAVQSCLVMGVCGSGKSMLGRNLADSLGAVFVEADDLHSKADIDAMARGIAMTDEKRLPWLKRVCAGARSHLDAGRPVVIACSALKRGYRDLMRADLGALGVIHLTGNPELIRTRMAQRKGHFMPTGLLESQLRDLEVPGVNEVALQIDISNAPEDVLRQALAFCKGLPATQSRNILQEGNGIGGQSAA